MAFALNDIVQVTPTDKQHPALNGNGYARVIHVSNSRNKIYKIAVGNLPGFLYVMDESDLTAYTGLVGGPLRASLVLPV